MQPLETGGNSHYADLPLTGGWRLSLRSPRIKRAGASQAQPPATHNQLHPIETMSEQPANEPDFSKNDGLLPAIAQDAETGEVLMLAYMNEESYAETVETGRAVYFSRSRGKLWRKGEESGNIQHVQEIRLDCDADTILLKVEQIGGAACHLGYRSCFFRKVTPEGLQIEGERVFDPDEVYKK